MFKIATLPSIRVFVLSSAVVLWSAALPPLVAQNWTAAVWTPYTDKYNMIHSVPVDKVTHDPSTNNGLLYTAEACVIMQLQHISYDRDKIAAGVKADEVKPGLFKRSPLDLKDREAPDDYVGLGALAGVCGFHDVARDILNYGNGEEQASGLKVLGLNSNDFTHLNDTLKQCQTIPYNYNNVDPDKFTLATWMGKFPAIITHWKLGAGDRPSQDEFAVWSAALMFSGKQDAPGQDHWLQSWLMVLTYEMSSYQSAVADFAVDQWWDMLHKRYPGGIKQTMTEYLAAGAQGNPLAEYIDDFAQARNPDKVAVDNDVSQSNLLDSVEGLLSMSCGQLAQPAVCVDYATFSPVNFLAPFTSSLSTAVDTVTEIQQAVATQQQLLELQITLARNASDLVAKANKSLASLQAQNTDLHQQAAKAVLQKADMVAKQLDKVHLPGHWVTPTKKIAGKKIPLGPPVFVPGPTKSNPDFDKLVGSITNLETEASAVQAKVDQTQAQLGNAQQDLISQNKAVDVLQVKVGQLQGDLTKAKAVLLVAKGALQYSQAIAQNLIPCGNILPGNSNK